MVNLYSAPAVRLRVLDVPQLDDCRSCCPGVFLAAALEANQLNRFEGAEVFWSRDNSVYESLAAVPVEGCIGSALTVLAAPGACNAGFDEVNTVDVEVFSGPKPESLPQDDVLDGRNLALLGGEVLSFRTATQLSELSYRLSGLMRGRLATEELVPLHTIGDEFTLLDRETLVFVPLRWGDVDTDRFFKAVSPGGALADAVAFGRRLRAMNVRPLAPRLLAAARNSPSANDVTITWKKRARGNFRLLGSTNMRLCCCDGPDYELEVWNTGETALLRTVELDDVESYVYTAAQQNADGIAPGAAVKLRVFQMSTSAGRGVRAFLNVP